MDFIFDVVDGVIDFIANNGWYIFISSVLLIYIYVNYVKDTLDKYLQQRAETQYLNEVKKNPDLFREKALAMEEARLKMQDKYLQAAEKHKEKQELLQQQKQAEKIERTSHVNVGQKLGFKPNEYNPLMGAGTSGGYRAPKRSCCGKK
ncbi:selenoprotein S-like [Chrysoperla carnea]|uniref:selenoprotein S-like n=1 Tax=Chrysoperla carnea TaxID=189513 RepID=UPI001D05F7F9|nr:selenoprotein S-like [Chrysoperla carnea]